ncbi:PLD nuclease N-terminal domain-containing protein [Kineococcus sp. SYSU DK005]|uniref:PLD nuclease N-terminal domain-containing protein n=1 Tax=Kineococcus sp. SYSU DK005 TaxID=3383126 RepID=UPI003D7E82A3
MRSVLPVLLVLALTVYCVVSIVQAGEGEVRNLPKWGWLLLVLFFPLAGGLAYVVAGRPAAGAVGRRTPPGRRPGPKGPDDDEDFLRGL